MSLRGNLFVKIFVGFWLVTIAILGSWLLTDDYFRALPSSRETAETPGGPPRPPHRFVLRSIYDLQHLPAQALPALVREARDKHRVEIYLLGAQGQDLLGREVPAAVARAAQKLGGGRRRAADHTRGQLLLAHDIYRPEEGPLRAVFQFRRPGPVLGWLGGRPWLRLGMAVFISGLICYLLSRLVTSRLKELQQASRRLAEGDLDARLQVREAGGDETDELARDFNSMARQLQERIWAQKRLLADVSHELRSPLARLRIALALAQEDESNAAGHLERIEREAERLEQLISQLLASQSSPAELDTQIDLVSLLRQLVRDADFEGQVSGRRVDFHSGVREAVVASSGDLLQKSFDNILRNALMHTPDHTTVTVELNAKDGRFEVAISDRGPGVPEGELEKIFDAFYRVDTARTREAGGHGLGLSIARRAIEQHGGSVAAANTATGLAVTVSLPGQPRGPDLHGAGLSARP